MAVKRRRKRRHSMIFLLIVMTMTMMTLMTKPRAMLQKPKQRKNPIISHRRRKVKERRARRSGLRTTQETMTIWRLA